MATMFEFDESDVWSSSNHHQHHHISSDHRLQNQFKKPIRSKKTSVTTSDHLRSATTGSCPVNVPDWAKILRQEHRREQVYADDYDESDDEEGNKRITPPHEFLAKQFARTRVSAASFSVHEGIGRTLKGRDLSRVRNAIWEKTGFED
ncbi:hypothetical protein MKW94_016967 [Papaver nudicaule]|uniref:Senescence regulator n=1 Tax=Papaver nudicaule TaxID=74823 RepID=A0AA42B3Y7_PAPNU|nr:hypothetical protein [Papaver nudicaule]